MNLYLTRHGEAKNESEDPERGLTDKGLEDIGKVARFLESSGVRVRKVLHSDKKRAMETAAVLGRHLKPEAGVNFAEGLSPMDDPGIWFTEASWADEDTMLVGHLPHLGRLASLLLLADADKNIINFTECAVLCLKRGGAGWFIEWMIAPKIIKELQDS